MKLDDPQTWPADVRSQAEMWAEMLHGSTEYVSDLDLEKEDEDVFRSKLAGRLVVAFHATRLLDIEVANIATNGLRLASHNLVLDRIDAAHRDCVIDDDLKERLTANVFAERDYSGRESQVLLRSIAEKLSMRTRVASTTY